MHSCMPSDLPSSSAVFESRVENRHLLRLNCLAVTFGCILSEWGVLEMPASGVASTVAAFDGDRFEFDMRTGNA